MAINATAFTHTPQAKDDVYSWTEDALLGSGPLTGNVVTLAVMVNDLGGNAKTLYSVDDGNGNTLVPDFDLLSADVTSGVSAWEATAAGNQIRINNGRIEFRLAGSLSGLGASDVNALAAGDLVRDEFVYAIRMANGTLSQARVSFSLAGANDAPVIAQGPQSGAVKEDETLTASGQFTATDADHNATQTWSVQGSGTYGAMAADATGKWTYTLANGAVAVQALAAAESHTETFTIRVTDDKGASADQTVTVTVRGTNDAPVISSSAQSGAVTEAANNSADEINNVTHQATGTLAFSDVDLTDAHTVTVSGNGMSGYRGTLSANVTHPSTGDGSGAIAWTFAVADGVLDDLGQGQVLTQTYGIAVNDGNGGTASQNVVITLTGAADNSPPVAVNDSPATNEDVPFSFNILANDTDVDGQTLSAVNISSLSNTALGTLQNLGSGQFSFNPAANASGTTSFTYQANDGQVNSGNTATVTIAVNAVDDAPVIGFKPANIVTNGSFEQPGAGVITAAVPGGSTAITGWTVTGNSVDYISSGLWQPADGAFSLDLDGNAPGGVQQTLVTAPGAQYTVTFAHAANVSGGGTRDLEVTAPGATKQYSFDSTGHNGTNMGWTKETFTFTATGSTSTLSFESRTSGASGPTLDAVSVVSNTVVTNEDTAVAISGLSVSDIDAGSDAMRLTVGVGHGALTLASTAGLTMVDGNGSDGTLSFTGSQSSINAALGSGVVYTPSLDYNGADALTATINDQGHNGSGGPLSATQTLAITVNPVDDGPPFVPFITGAQSGEGSSWYADSNAGGDVVGAYNDGVGSGRHGFLYNHAAGTFTSLDAGDPNMTVNPTAINAAGDVVGNYSGPATGYSPQAFLYHNGSYTQIQAGGYTYATAISSDGVIAGNYYPFDGNTYGFVYNGGHITNLPVYGLDGGMFVGITTTPKEVGPGGAWVTGYTSNGIDNHYQGWVYSNSLVTYLNAPDAAFNSRSHSMTQTYSLNFDGSGDVSGTYIDANSVVHGFVYNGGTYEEFNAPNGGVMNVNSVMAVADDGKAAGTYTGADGRAHGFVYDNGVVTSFNAPSGNINAFDNSYWGVAAGSLSIGPGDEVTGAYTDASNHVRGFVYQYGVTSTFDVPGSNRPNPKAIDANGDIIGTGYYGDWWDSHLFIANSNNGRSITGVNVISNNNAAHNFVMGPGGDVLDLSDLLTSNNAPHDSTAFSDGYLRFLQSNGDTVVQLDANGGADSFATLVNITGVLLSETDTPNYVL